MSYFDHVKCHACRASLAPESLARVPGHGLACPNCNAALSLTDLFGLKAAFAEEEEDDPSLDELVSGPSARPSSPAPTRRSASSATEEATEEPSAAMALMQQLKRRR